MRFATSRPSCSVGMHGLVEVVMLLIDWMYLNMSIDYNVSESDRKTQNVLVSNYHSASVPVGNQIRLSHLFVLVI